MSSAAQVLAGFDRSDADQARPASIGERRAGAHHATDEIARLLHHPSQGRRLSFCPFSSAPVT